MGWVEGMHPWDQAGRGRLWGSAAPAGLCRRPGQVSCSGWGAGSPRLAPAGPGPPAAPAPAPTQPGTVPPSAGWSPLPSETGPGRRGGVLVRGLGSSEERLSRALGATALPGRRLWEEEPLRGSCILRGWVQPPSLRSGSSPTPPASAQYLLFPSAGQGASRATSSLEPSTRSRHRAGTANGS